MDEHLAPLSPQWWLHRLLGNLSRDVPRMVLMERYYRGDHPLPYVPRQLKAEFKTMLARSRSNFMRIVVDAPSERMRLQGFRPVGSEQVSTEAWDVWRESGMDVDINLAITDSMSMGRTYFQVEDGRISVEDPRTTIVEYHPRNRHLRVAALQAWYDDFIGKVRARVHLPGERYDFVSLGSTIQASQRWPQDWEPAYPIDDVEVRHQNLLSREEPVEAATSWMRQWQEIDRLDGPDVIPIVEVVNRPSTTKRPDGESEIDDIYLTQDRINEMLFNRALAAWTTAYRQKWATGLDIPVDDDGKAIEPFQAAIDRLWVSESEETRFGEFGATDLKPFIESVEEDIAHIAVQTRTPRHYFLVSGQAPSGDSIKSAEAGLVAKVMEKRTAIGRAACEAVQLAMGGEQKLDAIWGDPEFRTLGELTDAVLKEYAAGLIPQKVALERLGYSPPEIARIQREMASEVVLSDARSALAEVQAPANPEPQLDNA